MSRKNKAFITVTHRYLAYFGTAGQAMKCKKCGVAFVVGDEIISKKWSRADRKRYHVHCWNGMFLEA